MLGDKIRYKTKITNEKLVELGRKVGLEESDINYARKTIASMIGIFVVAVIFAFIGTYSNQLDSIGLWYTGVSVKDFSLLSRFF